MFTPPLNRRFFLKNALLTGAFGNVLFCEELRANTAFKASTYVVKDALEWLKRHQSSDGSWNFSLKKACEKSTCSDENTGADSEPNAATALALFAFLSTGQTHKTGRYQKTIQNGLKFLTKNLRTVSDLPDCSTIPDSEELDAHAFASLALTEALFQSKDEALRAPAQAALNYTQYARNPAHGGWGHSFQALEGNTTSTLLQLLACKSGTACELAIKPEIQPSVMRFLNSVQLEEGTFYGNTVPEKDPTATAAGLLCRLHCGWTPENPAMKRGVTYLKKLGPSTANMEFNFYASQVLRNGEYSYDSSQWFQNQRDVLFSVQNNTETDAHGSWNPDTEKHGGIPACRLRETAMAILASTVYYRYASIFRSMMFTGS